MHLQLTEQQTMIKNMVRDFADQTIAPQAAMIDKEKKFPKEILSKMAGQGLLGIIIPTTYGGAGLDMVTYSIIIEEISRRCASTGAITNVHNCLTAYPIVTYGTEEQKKNYLPQLANGSLIGAYAATEPKAGSDLNAISTTATKKGDQYILNGTKTFVTNGPEAGLFIVIAKTDSEAEKNHLSAFIVAADTPGITKGDIQDKIGLNGAHLCSITFKNCTIPTTQLLGTEGKGIHIALDAITTGRIGIAAQCVGIAQEAIEESIIYSQERQQFNRPLSAFQAIQNKVAVMATNIEASRYLTYHAAFEKDQGKNINKLASMAKLFASETCVDVALDAVQIHGGYGYTKEYTVERLYRDSKVTEIYEGTSEIQKVAIAKELYR